MTRPAVWTPPDLSGQVACVAGGSYGVGRAIAEVLGECGATVYVTGRSTSSSATKDERWTIEETADLVEAAGGHGSRCGSTTPRNSRCARCSTASRRSRGASMSS